MDATVVELIDCLVEGLTIDALALVSQLLVQLGKLILDLFGLALELLVIETMLGLAIDAKLFLV